MLRDLLWGSLTVSLTIQTNKYLIAHEADLTRRPPARPARVVTVAFPFFEVLLDLAADTLAHMEGVKNASQTQKIN